MPISRAALDNDLLVLDATATPREIHDRLGTSERRRRHVVIRLGGGRFAVFTPDELIAALWRGATDLPRHPVDAALTALPGFLADHEVEAVEAASMTTPQAESRLQRSRHRRLLVLQDGEVLGLLADLTRSRAAPRRSWPDEVARPPGPAQLTANLGAGAAPTAGTGDRSSATPRPDAAEQRFVNCEVLDHDPGQPLRRGEIYTLALDVDVERRAGAGTAPFEYELTAREELVELTVQLSSRDVAIYTDPRVLRVPRRGRSKNTVRFDVEPRAAGQGTIEAVLRKEGNFVQHLTIVVFTEVPCPGGVLRVESAGRAIEAAERLRPRDATLVILPRGDRFQALWCLEGVWSAVLPITLHGLVEAIDEARATLRDVVYARLGPDGPTPYLSGLDIPPDLDREALRALAGVGFRLFRRLFFDGAGEDARAIGTRLRAAAERGPLKLQVVSRELVMPWALLYLANRFDGDRVEPERFLGLTHIVEHLPFQPRLSLPDCDVPTRPRLSVSLNVNVDIDRETRRPFVARLLERWQAIRAGTGADVVVRRTREEVLTALTSPTTPDQIIYFFCHAETQPAARTDGGRDDGSSDAACVILTGAQPLTLADLKLAADLDLTLPGAPLVFINACGSSELSPLFYNGFGPQLLSLGARGVIGTECDVPAVFAAAWAERFFELWLAGMGLGEVILTLRQDFYARHRNVLGLLYAVYCDADTRVVPALELSSLLTGG